MDILSIAKQIRDKQAKTSGPGQTARQDMPPAPSSGRQGGEESEFSEIRVSSALTLSGLLSQVRAAGCPVIADCLAELVRGDPAKTADAISIAGRVLAGRDRPPARPCRSCRRPCESGRLCFVCEHHHEEKR